MWWWGACIMVCVSIRKKGSGKCLFVCFFSLAISTHCLSCLFIGGVCVGWYEVVVVSFLIWRLDHFGVRDRAYYWYRVGVSCLARWPFSGVSVWDIPLARASNVTLLSTFVTSEPSTIHRGSESCAI